MPEKIPQNIQEKIIRENFVQHEREAAVYDVAHPEIFRAANQERIDRFLDMATSLVRDTEMRALDLGCGTGNITLKLLEHGFSVDAVDISPAMVGVLEEKGVIGQQSSGNSSKLRTFVKPVDDYLVYSQEKYDLITTSSLLHHLPDYPSTIGLIVKHLKPGGILVNLHEPTGEEPSIAFQPVVFVDPYVYNIIFLPWHAKRTVFSIDYTYTDYLVEHGFTIDDTVSILKNKEMNIIEIEKYNSLKLRFSTWLMDKFCPCKMEFNSLSQKPENDD